MTLGPGVINFLSVEHDSTVATPQEIIVNDGTISGSFVEESVHRPPPLQACNSCKFFIHVRNRHPPDCKNSCGLAACLKCNPRPYALQVIEGKCQYNQQHHITQDLDGVCWLFVPHPDL